MDRERNTKGTKGKHKKHKKIFFVPFVLLLVPFAVLPPFLAQNAPPPSETTTIFLARHAQTLQRQSTATMHYLELFQIRRRWVLPDIGYIDFGRSDYREMFIGGGYTLYEREHFNFTQELFFEKAFGSASNDAKYLVPWTMIQYSLTDRLGGEAVYFPYLPLDKSGRAQHVLERAKLERSIGKHWKAGAGLGGYKYADNPWSHRPFLTSTLNTPWGAWEFWLQRLPANKAQFQIRYAIVAHR